MESIGGQIINDIPDHNLNNDNQIENTNKYDFYLLIYNLQSKHNVGTLIRSASAFNCKKIIVLGENKKVLKRFFGHQGTLKKMEFVYLQTVDELKKYCKDNNIYICGVEIGGASVPIQKQPFKGNTLFVLGNEGAGMNQKQKEMCDQLVYIPQYSSKTGSLNVAIAGSIIFHHFAVWADYKEAEFTDEKYDVKRVIRDGNEYRNNEEEGVEANKDNKDNNNDFDIISESHNGNVEFDN